MAKRKVAAKAAPADAGYDVTVTITIEKGDRLISAPSVPMYGVPYSDVVAVQEVVGGALVGLGKAKLAAGK